MSEIIEAAIRELDGVATAHIETDGSAVTGVKVALEEGADERVIGLAIGRLLEAHGFRSRVAPERVKVEPETAPMPPVEIASRPKSDRPLHLRSVTVEEDRAGAAVTVVDSTGNEATRRAGSTSDGRRRAIVEAVASLLSQSASPHLDEVMQREDGVLLVVLEDVDGVRLAGASVVQSGADFALASAVWAAMAGLRQ